MGRQMLAAPWAPGMCSNSTLTARVLRTCTVSRRHFLLLDGAQRDELVTLSMRDTRAKCVILTHGITGLVPETCQNWVLSVLVLILLVLVHLNQISSFS